MRNPETTMKKALIAFGAAAAVVSCVVPLGAPAVAARRGAAQVDPGAANVALVKAFLTDIRKAMAAKDSAQIRAVSERYMDAGYIQHAEQFEPGREGYISGMVKTLNGHPPGGGNVASPPRDLHFVGNRDFVTWMSEVPAPDGSKRFAFNMFRVVGGKFKEHWGTP